MNKTLILITLIFLVGCTYEIESNVDFSKLEFKEEPSECGYYYFDLIYVMYAQGENNLYEELIIKTQEEYEAHQQFIFENLFENPINNADFFETFDEYYSTCNNFPEIDFDNYMILANYATGGGCSIDFDVKIVLEEDKLRHIVEVDEKGMCDMLGANKNKVVVPKFDGVDVVFEVIR